MNDDWDKGETNEHYINTVINRWPFGILVAWSSRLAKSPYVDPG